MVVNFLNVFNSRPGHHQPIHDFGVGRRRKKELMMGKSGRLENVSDELQSLRNVNLDNVAARRRVREAFKDVQLNLDHILFKMPKDGLKIEEIYQKNSRGVEIFSKSWLPVSSHPKALLFLCHGYGDTCTFFFEGIARKFAAAGYGVFAMDYPGFGLSEGLHGYIKNFDTLVDDVIEIYSRVKENPEFHNLPSFLLGESMGGAVALKVHLKQPKAWSGAILVAPMCKIADDMQPPWLLKQLLISMSNLFPKQKVVPSQDLGDAAFRDLKKREQARYNVICYKDKPRLQTAVELLKATQDIESQLKEVSLPLLILHGEADIVTDPSVSKALHKNASSSDKILQLYKDAYHALLEGEPDEFITQVLDDILQWLNKHSRINIAI